MPQLMPLVWGFSIVILLVVWVLGCVVYSYYSHEGLVNTKILGGGVQWCW